MLLREMHVSARNACFLREMPVSARFSLLGFCAKRMLLREMHVSARNACFCAKCMFLLGFALPGLHCEKPLQGCAWSHPGNCRVPLRYHPGNCRVLWCMVSTGSDPGYVVVGYMSQCLILSISECCSWRSSSQDIIPVSHTGDHH